MQIKETFPETDGHTTIILDPGSDLGDLKQKIIDVLENVWIGDIAYDDDIDDYKAALAEFDIDLEAELHSRGLDEPFAPTKDRLVKDRGDVGEVLGYLRETVIRGVPPTDIFVPLIWAKLKGGVTTHGIDGICFIWTPDEEPDQMILCEWKHTSISTSVQLPCSSAADEWNNLVFRRLLQEMRRVRRIYQDRSQIDLAKRTKWCAFNWRKKDSSVICTTMVVCPEEVPIDKARQEISAHLVLKCAQHASESTVPGMHEADLLPLPEMVEFLDKCHQEFMNDG